MEEEIWSWYLDFLFLRPNPEQTSAQRLIFRCQQLLLSVQSWSACLVQVLQTHFCTQPVSPVIHDVWKKLQSVLPHVQYWPVHYNPEWYRDLCRCYSEEWSHLALQFLQTHIDTSSLGYILADEWRPAHLNRNKIQIFNLIFSPTLISDNVTDDHESLTF